MAESVAITDLQGGVRLITLNRPEKKNALTGAMYDAMREALAAADVPPEVGVPEPVALLEPLELQPAATRPVTARATALSHMGCLIFTSFVMVESFDQAWGSGPGQAAVSPR